MKPIDRTVKRVLEDAAAPIAFRDVNVPAEAMADAVAYAVRKLAELRGSRCA